MVRSRRQRAVGLDRPGATLNGPAGNYTYRTTFSLAGLDALTASINGQWAADNGGLDILINGISTGSTASGFMAFTSFAINSGFVTGLNTLDFVLNNRTFGPTGLRVEMSGNAVALPEPGSVALVALGLLALVVPRLGQQRAGTRQQQR